MASKNQAIKKIHSLFQLPGNRENLELLYKSLSQPSKGFCLCQAMPEERAKILGFFYNDPSLVKRIHIIDIANPPLGPMELQQTIIAAYDRFGTKKDIYFIYNIEENIRLLKTTADVFFQGINLIRDFFMQFEVEFVFFIDEALGKTIIKKAFDFYDWMKFTFIFVPESKGVYLQPLAPEEEKIEYSNPLDKIKYLEKSIKRVKNEKARSRQLLELGRLYFQIGDYKNALVHFSKALVIEEKYRDFSNMATLYNETGLSHSANEDKEKALAAFDKAAKIYTENNDRHSLERVRANMNSLKEDIQNPKVNIKDTGAADHSNPPRTADKYNFNWDKLLTHIHHQTVIPVIGQGLYRVELESQGKSNILLYDYLAGHVAEECGSTFHPDENHKFAKACFEFLKKSNNDYKQLSSFLKECLKGVWLVPDNSLVKLARIKAFNIFFTTAYDDFLVKTINNVRLIPTKVRYYSLMEKKLARPGSDLIDCIGNSQCTLVYHLFGSMEKNKWPAYTERDILETLLEFKKDLEWQADNYLFQVLKESMLFIGVGFADWLFRLFIRTISNKPYEYGGKGPSAKFVADDFSNWQTDPFQELDRFLRDYDYNVFYSGVQFVDLLFEKLSKTYPEEIIPPEDFPAVAYISFAGQDRSSARRMAAQLRADGIKVWLDEMNLTGGDEVDKTILNAIANCPVFIPLISRNSREILTGDGNLRYHVREWEYAYSRYISGNDILIIPVLIDDTERIYDKFKGFNHLKIQVGNRGGEYEKLRQKLAEVQKGK